MKTIVTIAAMAAIAAPFAMPVSADAQGFPRMPRIERPSLGGDLSEADIARFIAIAVQSESILSDTDLDEAARRAAIALLVEEAGWDMVRFRAIAGMVADTPLLRRRVPSEVLAFITAA